MRENLGESIIPCHVGRKRTAESGSFHAVAAGLHGSVYTLTFRTSDTTSAKTMRSHTSSSAGRADAETQLCSYHVRFAGMVKLRCRSSQDTRAGGGGLDGLCRRGKNR